METTPKGRSSSFWRGAWSSLSIDRVPSQNSLQKNNRLAFEASVKAVTSLFQGEWRGKKEIMVDNAMHLTMAVSSASSPSLKGSLTNIFSLLSCQSPPLASGIK